MTRNVRYALACRDATNRAPRYQRKLIILGLGRLRHDKLKHIGHHSGLPHLLQNLAPGSRCSAPHDEQVRPIFKFAPHEEQKSDPATLAAPHVPHLPGNGGT